MVISSSLLTTVSHVQLIIISFKVDHDVIHNKTMPRRWTWKRGCLSSGSRVPLRVVSNLDTVHWIKVQKWVEGDGTGKMEIDGLRQSCSLNYFIDVLWLTYWWTFILHSLCSYQHIVYTKCASLSSLYSSWSMQEDNWGGTTDTDLSDVRQSPHVHTHTDTHRNTTSSQCSASNTFQRLRIQQPYSETTARVALCGSCRCDAHSHIYNSTWHSDHAMG